MNLTSARLALNYICSVPLQWNAPVSTKHRREIDPRVEPPRPVYQPIPKPAMPPSPKPVSTEAPMPMVETQIRIEHFLDYWLGPQLLTQLRSSHTMAVRSATRVSRGILESLRLRCVFLHSQA